MQSGAAMEIEFAYDAQRRLLKMTLQGAVDGQKLADLIETSREINSRIEPALVVYDCTGVTSINILSAMVESFAGIRPVFSRETKEVILAPQDFIYGLARMFQAMAAEQRPNVRVARSWAEANQVLGVDGAPSYERLSVA